MKWKKVSLGSISIKTDYGYTESATFDPVGPKFLRITDIVNPEINWETVPYCPISPENFSKYKLELGDIVIARTGATTGYNAIFEKDISAVFASYLIRFKINQKVAIPKYISYMLNTSEYRGFISGAISGAAQPGINAQVLSSFSFALPPITIQEKIAGVLSTYDQLIENNTRRIAVLEKMAQELYKEWFVRFRFPGHEHVKMVNGVPEGWTIKRLSEVIRITRGRSYTSDEINDTTGISFVNLKNINPYGGFNSENDALKYYVGQNESKSEHLRKNDLIMGVTDMTQERRIVGSVALVPDYLDGSIFTMDLIKLIPKEGEDSTIFYYSLMRFGGLSRYIAQFANGANVLHLNPEVALKTKYIHPDSKLINQYIIIVKPIIDRITQCLKQNQNLIKQRDLLLPRLMSGKLELP